MTLFDVRKGPPPTPYRIRLDGDRVLPTVAQAIDAVASEYPGDRAVVLDVAGTERTVTLPTRVTVTSAFEQALRRVVQAHTTTDE